MPRGLSKFTTCPKCNWDIRCNSLRRHIKVCDGTGIKSRQLKIKINHPDNLICDKCGRTFTTKSGYSKHVRKTTSDGSCSHPPWKQPEKRIWTEEQKQHLSVKRKSFLKENPDKHPWKNKDKQTSKPAEKLKEFLRSKDLIFVEEWTPLTDRMFSIDIAFPDIKLGLEVNGNQHYERDGSLKPYYQERHDLIEAAGWTLIELHYTSCFNEEQLSKVLEIKEQPDYSEYFRIKEAKKSRKEKCANADEEAIKIRKSILKKENSTKIKKTLNKIRGLPKGLKHTLDTEIKWEPYKDRVINSGIDFSKFGWVQQVSAILKVQPQSVNRWMKKYLPEHYENKCFKRVAARERFELPT